MSKHAVRFPVDAARPRAALSAILSVIRSGLYSGEIEVEVSGVLRGRTERDPARTTKRKSVQSGVTPFVSNQRAPYGSLRSLTKRVVDGMNGHEITLSSVIDRLHDEGLRFNARRRGQVSHSLFDLARDGFLKRAGKRSVGRGLQCVYERAHA